MVFGSAPHASITVVERSGRKSTVARSWAGYGLAWTPSGQEIWFTATPAGSAPYVRAASLSGAGRIVHRAPDWLVLHDIAADGRVLMSRNTIQIGLACRKPADDRERDLSWTLASAPTGISPDGETVIFADELNAAPSGAPTLFRRGTDGSPAVPIGEGTGGRSVSGREMGGHPVRRRSRAVADRSWRHGRSAEGGPRTDRTGNLARRFEARRLHRRGTQRQSREATFRRSRPAFRVQ